MNKIVYYGCGCVFSFEQTRDGVVTVDKDFTLCHKHGFDLYKDYIGKPNLNTVYEPFTVGDKE